MRLNDFTFNGLAIVPEVTSEGNHSGYVDSMRNIKTIMEAKSLHIALGIAIEEMQHKEQKDRHDAITRLQEDLERKRAELGSQESKLSNMKGEYFGDYGFHWSINGMRETE